MKQTTRLPAPRFQPLNRGFTLIEMLVVISIIVLLIGSGLAAYIRYSDRQSVEITTRKLHDVFISARSRARFKERATCDPLEGVIGFRVLVTATGEANILTICGNSRVGYADPANPGDLVGSLSYDADRFATTPAPPFQVDYFSLYGGASLPSDADEIDISVARGAAEYGFTLDRGGDITPVVKIR